MAIKINAVTGSNTDLPINTLVQLDSSVTAATYTWEILDQPAGSSDALSATNIKNPTFTPTSEGSYLIKLTLAGGATDQVVAAVKQLKTLIRIPAAQEDVETGIDGWATDANRNFQKLDSVAADPGVVVGVAGAAGLVKGNILRCTGSTTIKSGLPGEEVLPRFTKADATLATNLNELLGILEGGVDGSTTPGSGALIKVRIFGRFSSSVTESGAVVGEVLYVTDTGTLSITAGSNRRVVGSVCAATATTFDCWFSGTIVEPSPSNGVIGSGTNAYIPQWVGTNILSNSPMSMSGTKLFMPFTEVGIGTSSPANKTLDIAIAAASALGPTLRLMNNLGFINAKCHIDLTTYDPLGNDPGARIVINDDGSWGNSYNFMNKTPGAITNTLTSRLFIQSDGKVGINTASPISQLDVRGTILSIVASGGAALEATNNTDSTIILSPVGSGQARIKTDSAGRWLTLADGDGTVDVVHVKSGRVAIGTTASATYTLEVNKSVSGNHLGGIKNTSTSGYSSFAYLDNSGTVKAAVGFANGSAGTYANKAFFDAVTGTDLALGVNNVPIITVTSTSVSMANKLVITQAVETSDSPVAFKVTGAAHTTLTASTEDNDVFLDLARTVQWATGAVATQRAVRISNPTYAFVGASTITNAATLAVVGAPVAGTNATITNSYALWVQSGKSNFDGDVRIDGKLTVTGAIDPTSLTLVGTSNDAYIEQAAGASASTAPANRGRLRYNQSTQAWQSSANTGSYADILISGGIVSASTLSAKTHSNFTGSDFFYITGAVQTTEATQTSVATKTLADNTLYSFEVTIIGRETGGTDRAMYSKKALVYRQGGGSATMQGTVLNLVTDVETVGAATWDATIVVSGNDVQIAVTGAASTIINWACRIEYQAVSTNS